MKSLLKEMCIILCACMISFQFAGCGDKQSANVGNIKKITVWSSDSHSKTVVNKLVNDYNKTIGKEKGIEIIYEVKEGNLSQNIDLALTADGAPDMFQGGDLTKLVSNGYIAAIGDLPGGSEFLEKYKDITREYLNSLDGKTYCVPCATTTQGLIYNKDMFKKAGLVDEKGEAKPPETMDELRQYSKKLTNPDKREYGIILPLKWSGWYGSDIISPSMSSFGNVGYDPKTGAFDFSILKPMMETIMGIKKDQSYYPGAEGMENDPARARFAEGGIGMKFAYSWDVGVLNNQFPAKCDWGVAPYPVLDKNNKYLQLMQPKGSFKINNKSVDEKGADVLMNVYKWFNSDETLAELYKNGVEIPYKYDIINSIKLNNPLKGWKDFSDLLEISIAQPTCIQYDISGQKSIDQVFINEIWNDGTITIDEAIEDYNKAVNDGVKKYAELHPDYNGSRFINNTWDISR